MDDRYGVRACVSSIWGCVLSGGKGLAGSASEAGGRRAGRRAQGTVGCWELRYVPTKDSPLLGADGVGQPVVLEGRSNTAKAKSERAERRPS